jgi:hypothetical protein
VPACSSVAVASMGLSPICSTCSMVFVNSSISSIRRWYAELDVQLV